MVISALGVLSLGVLCACRAGAGVLQLFPRPAADHKVGIDTSVRHRPVRSVRTCGGHRVGDRHHPRRFGYDWLWCLSVRLRHLQHHRRRLDDDNRRRTDAASTASGADCRDGRFNALGAVRGGARHQMAVKHQYGAVIVPSWLLHPVWRDDFRHQGAVCGSVGLYPCPCSHVGDGLDGGWHPARRGACRMAGRLDDLLLGMVDCLCAFRRPFPGADFSGT